MIQQRKMVISSSVSTQRRARKDEDSKERRTQVSQTTDPLERPTAVSSQVSSKTKTRPAKISANATRTRQTFPVVKTTMHQTVASASTHEPDTSQPCHCQVLQLYLYHLLMEDDMFRTWSLPRLHRGDCTDLTGPVTTIVEPWTGLVQDKAWVWPFWLYAML